MSLSEPLDALRSAALSWYVGHDAYGTKIGDALWDGAQIDEATRERVVGLFRLSFRDVSCVIERLKGEGCLSHPRDGKHRWDPSYEAAQLADGSARAKSGEDAT